MEEEEDMLPPFWLQSDGGRRRRLRRSYSLMFSSGALLIFIMVIACVIIFIVLPTLRSFTSNIFRPQSVKKSWDSLNLVLVLFAIVCGFLGRNSNETPRSYEDRRFSETASAREHVKSNPETPTRRWYEYSESDRTAVNRMRSFNSYPDLRQESLWVAGDDRWRFHDDTHVGGYRGSDLDDHRQLRHRRARSEVIEEEQDYVKNIAVDTFVVREKEVPCAPPIPETRLPPPSPPQVQPTVGVRRYAKPTYHDAGRSEMTVREEKDELEVKKSQPPYSTMATPSPPPPPPPAPPAKDVRKNSRRTYRSSRQAPMIEKEESSELEVRNFPPPPPSIPPPPPPPALPLFYLSSEKKTGKKKRASATKEFLTSLRGKKKKQRQRSVENFESILNSQAPHLPPSTPPPPPPPPPPPSVFYNLFSPRKPKHKKVHSVPPPPREPSPPRVLSTRVSKTQKPPISNEREIFNSMEGNVLTGNESPFNPIPPPPPPPPPFKIPAWKFRVQGDFVRIDSIRSSRSNSPDIDEGVDSPTHQEQPMTPPLFCPSPDVDTKADTFIARFRAGLTLEKMNSMKGKSKLGPS